MTIKKERFLRMITRWRLISLIHAYNSKGPLPARISVPETLIRMKLDRSKENGEESKTLVD